MDKRQQKLIQQARNNNIRAEIIRLNLKDHESISQILNIPRQTAKQHLTILKRCGLIQYRNTDLIHQGVSKNALR